MKHITTIFFFTFFLSTTSAQNKLVAKDAHRYVNKCIMICDTVYGTKVINSNVRLLYLGAKYPNQQLTIIQKNNIAKFKKSSSSLTKFKICVNGIVRTNKGKLTMTTKKILVLGPIDL